MSGTLVNFPFFTSPPIKAEKQQNKFENKSFGNFIKDVQRDEVVDLLIKPNTKKAYFMEADGSYGMTNYPETNEFWRTIMYSDMNIEIDNTVPISISDVFSVMFMIFLLASLVRMATSSLGGGSGPPFMKPAKIDVEDNIPTRFSDVQGIDEAREELEEVVDFLKHPTKYVKSGAKIPKGALLVGNPGTGKTLLARAIAGESLVPFIQVSGSSFVEMFVGMGAKRVRDVFTAARSMQPCILFIDEIDAIGKARTNNGMPSNDEREQTINQLLTEMDGFSKSQVIVIGATNRVDILDPALLRPGRFDRKIRVKLPDTRGRQKILNVHSKEKQFSEAVSMKSIAKQTTGFSGADLANLLNECAIRAAKETEDYVITPEIVENTYQRLVVGAKGNVLMSPDTKRRIAVHEAGHAIVGSLMSDYEQVRKVSIIPRGDAGGITFFQPQTDEMRMYTKEYMLAQIKVALAGHAAEELMYGKENVSTGASADFSKVYAVAKDMIMSFGFGNTLNKINVKNMNISNGTMYNIEQEINQIVLDSYTNTISLLERYERQLYELTDTLIEQEVVDGEYVYSLVKKKLN